MSAAKTGGPAFPVRLENNFSDATAIFDDQIPQGHAIQYGGISMRDYFAAKAMQALALDHIDFRERDLGLARDAYLIADAMIAERAK